MPERPRALTHKPVLAFTTTQVCDALNASFEEYLLPVNFTPVATERRFRSEHLDPEASQVYMLEDRVAGIVMVARRGWNARIAAMGVAKPFRHQGVGKHIMQNAVQDAHERGDRRLVLEVFEQNPNAVRLYQSMGFQVTRRLLSFRRPAEASVRLERAAHLDQIDPLRFARVTALESDPDLPWMLAPEGWAAQVAPVRAFALEEAAFALVRDTPSDAFILLGLIVHRDQRNRGFGTRMVRALTALHAGKACQIIQIVPENLAPGFFKHLGFEPLPLNQFEMRLEL
jgi:ribosomal protein S18 acetylase RimI-like enzyme